MLSAMITNTFLPVLVPTGNCFLAIWSAHGRWRPPPTRFLIDSYGFLWIFQLEVSLEPYRFPMRKLRKIMIFDAFQTLRYLISGYLLIVLLHFYTLLGSIEKLYRRIWWKLFEPRVVTVESQSKMTLGRRRSWDCAKAWPEPKSIDFLEKSWFSTIFKPLDIWFPHTPRLFLLHFYVLVGSIKKLYRRIW